MKSRIYVWGGAVLAFVVAAVPSFAAADPTLTSQSSTLTTYFTDNIGTVIGAFVAVAMAIWILNLLFRSVGVKKPTKVG